jgi:PadR family transcriptional regulator PadR
MAKFKETVVRAILPHIILNMVSQEPIHGYAVIVGVRRVYSVYLGPSTIYPCLLRLEKDGYVQSEWSMQGGRPRKVYSLTAKGRAFLEQTATELSLITKTVEVKTA